MIRRDGTSRKTHHAKELVPVGSKRETLFDLYGHRHGFRSTSDVRDSLKGTQLRGFSLANIYHQVGSSYIIDHLTCIVKDCFEKIASATAFLINHLESGQYQASSHRSKNVVEQSNENRPLRTI